MLPKHTLYAHWKANQYEVTFDANGGALEQGAEQKITATYDMPYTELKDHFKFTVASLKPLIARYKELSKTYQQSLKARMHKVEHELPLWYSPTDHGLKFLRNMPRRPKVPCKHPGCPELVNPGDMYCEIHKPMHPEIIRQAHGRGYGKRWQRESKVFLRSHPLCEECKKNGRFVQATVVDHIVPHRGDMNLFWDRANWQALCKPCHDRKTWTEDANPEYKF